MKYDSSLGKNPRWMGPRGWGISKHNSIYDPSYVILLCATEQGWQKIPRNISILDPPGPLIPCLLTMCMRSMMAKYQA